MRGRVFLFPPQYSQLNGWGAALTTVTLFSLTPGLTRLVLEAGLSPLQILAACLSAARLLLWLHWAAGWRRSAPELGFMLPDAGRWKNKNVVITSSERKVKRARGTYRPF